MANDCPGLRPCPSIEDLVNDPKVDEVCVATPHNLHAEGIAAAARASRHYENPGKLVDESSMPGDADKYRIEAEPFAD